MVENPTLSDLSAEELQEYIEARQEGGRPSKMLQKAINDTGRQVASETWQGAATVAGSGAGIGALAATAAIVGGTAAVIGGLALTNTPPTWLGTGENLLGGVHKAGDALSFSDAVYQGAGLGTQLATSTAGLVTIGAGAAAGGVVGYVRENNKINEAKAEAAERELRRVKEDTLTTKLESAEKSATYWQDRYYSEVAPGTAKGEGRGGRSRG